MNENENPNSSAPPAGPPPSPSGIRFADLNPKKPCFRVTHGKNNPVTDEAFLAGWLKQVWVVWDDGYEGATAQSSVPARWEINVLLEDEQGNDILASVATQTAATSLAYSLVQIVEGRVWTGLTPAKLKDACVMNVASYQGGSWKHYFSPKSAEGSTPAERNADAIEKLRAHPLYKLPAKEKKDRRMLAPAGQDQTGGGKVTPERPANFSGSAEGGANPAHSAGGTQAAVVKTPEGVGAFGYVPPQWVPEGAFDADPTPRQLDLWVTYMSQRNIDQPPFRDEVFAQVCRAYQINGKGGENWGKGHYTLANDFAKNADVDQFKACATAAQAELAKAGTQVSADEYDPFADE